MEVNIKDLIKKKGNRSFQVKWSAEFPWVNYGNEKMYCTLCVKFPDLTTRGFNKKIYQK